MLTPHDTRFWGMRRGREGWIDPGCVRKLNASEVIAHKENKQRASHKSPYKAGGAQDISKVTATLA